MSFDLFDFLPMLYREADATDGSFQSFVWGFNSMVTSLVTQIEAIPQNLINPAITPLIEDLCTHRGNPFLCFTDDQLRKIADNLMFIYMRRGSASGMVNVVRFILGLEISMTMDYNFCWKLGLTGRGELGKATTLSSRNSPMFHLTLPSTLTDTQKEQILAIIQFMKPNYLCYQTLEAAPPTPPEPVNTNAATWNADNYGGYGNVTQFWVAGNAGNPLWFVVSNAPDDATYAWHMSITDVQNRGTVLTYGPVVNASSCRITHLAANEGDSVTITCVVSSVSQGNVTLTKTIPWG